MAITTEAHVFRELLTDLRAILALGDTSHFDLHSDRVFIRAVAGFEPEVKPPYVQLVPGSASMEHFDTGPGLVEQTFQTVVYDRIPMLGPGIDTTRLTDATYGLMVLRNIIRGDGGGEDSVGPGSTPSGLAYRDLFNGGRVSQFPITLLSWSVPQANPADPYWVMASDTWRMKWEIW